MSKVSNAYLSQLERGDRGIPTLKVLSRLADAYGASVEELVKVAQQTTAGKKTVPETDLQFVARSLEKLSNKEREEFLGWLKFKMSQKGKDAEAKKTICFQKYAKPAPDAAGRKEP
jgi:transcriptional regulator with XRE-family HTH domain